MDPLGLLVGGEVVKLTNEALLDFIKSYRAEHDYSPTVLEISVEFDVSTSTVHNRLCRLREAGLVTWHPESSRTLVVSE